MTRTNQDTVERLRRDIDSGRTGDKIPGADPAAAPLGTDEEAAGTPVSGSRVARARRIETSTPHPTPQRGVGVGSGWVLVAFIVLAGVVLVLAGIAFR